MRGTERDIGGIRCYKGLYSLHSAKATINYDHLGERLIHNFSKLARIYTEAFAVEVKSAAIFLFGYLSTS